MDDNAHGHAEELVDAAHPLRVAFCQVVVHGDNVDALACERIQVHGSGGDEGLAFTGLHFGDTALVQDHAADQLDIEMPHVEHAATHFADHRKGFFENVVERRALSETLLEIDGLSGQIDVGKFLERGFEGVDPDNAGSQ